MKNMNLFFSELQKEFAVLFAGLIIRTRELLTRRPKACFLLMIVLMATSAVMCYFLHQQRRVKVAVEKPVLSSLDTGLGQISQTAEKLKANFNLQSQVQLLLSKDSLNTIDSLHLKALLLKIRQIR